MTARVRSMESADPSPTECNPLWEAWRGGSAPADQHCAGCAWQYMGGRGRPVSRCHRFRGARVDENWAACPAFIATEDLSCDDCGACCREAFHVVELSPRDPFRAARPDLVEQEDGRHVLKRNAQGWCPCLSRTSCGFRCGEYEQRPRTCRDFTLGSANCCEARRRVGRTP